MRSIRSFSMICFARTPFLRNMHISLNVGRDDLWYGMANKEVPKARACRCLAARFWCNSSVLYTRIASIVGDCCTAKMNGVTGTDIALAPGKQGPEAAPYAGSMTR